MVEHKAALAQKRKAAKELKHTSSGIEKQSKKQKVPSQQALTTPTNPAAKKPKMSGGLSRSKSNSKSTQPVATKSSMVQFCTPLQRATSEKPAQRAVSALERAEQRQLQEAIALSKSEGAPDTPKKEPSAGDYQKMLQQSMIVSPRTEGVVDLHMLPSMQESDVNVLDGVELSKLTEVTKSHFQFMMGRVNSPLVAHLLGPANLGVVDGFCLNSNIRATSINQNFRVYDLMSLLSFRPVSDAVITCYLHWLQSTTQNVYFANPCLFRYMEP